MAALAQQRCSCPYLSLMCRRSIGKQLPSLRPACPVLHDALYCPQQHLQRLLQGSVVIGRLLPDTPRSPLPAVCFGCRYSWCKSGRGLSKSRYICKKERCSRILYGVQRDLPLYSLPDQSAPHCILPAQNTSHPQLLGGTTCISPAFVFCPAAT